jgi:hypothetical protein
MDINNSQFQKVSHSVKYYGGWGADDIDPSILASSAAANAETINKIKKALAKKSLLTRKNIYQLLKEKYFQIGDILLPEDVVPIARKDQYLRRWARDLGLPNE